MAIRKGNGKTVITLLITRFIGLRKVHFWAKKECAACNTRADIRTRNGSVVVDLSSGTSFIPIGEGHIRLKLAVQSW